MSFVGQICSGKFQRLTNIFLLEVGIVPKQLAAVGIDRDGRTVGAFHEYKVVRSSASDSV